MYTGFWGKVFNEIKSSICDNIYNIHSCKHCIAVQWCLCENWFQFFYSIVCMFFFSTVQYWPCSVCTRLCGKSLSNSGISFGKPLEHPDPTHLCVKGVRTLEQDPAHPMCVKGVLCYQSTRAWARHSLPSGREGLAREKLSLTLHTCVWRMFGTLEQDLTHPMCVKGVWCLCLCVQATILII